MAATNATQRTESGVVAATIEYYKNWAFIVVYLTLLVFSAESFTMRAKKPDPDVGFPLLMIFFATGGIMIMSLTTFMSCLKLFDAWVHLLKQVFWF